MTNSGFVLQQRGGRGRLLRCAGLLLCGSLMGPGPAQSDERFAMQWPTQVRSFSIGDRVTLNGTPMRLWGFVSAMPPAAAASAFRQTLGKPLVENALPEKVLLGRQEGEHYLVVQIEAAGGGSRGVVALSDLNTALEKRADAEETARRWLSRLPSGSTLVSQMDSEDGLKLSRHLVFGNTLDEALNRDRLVSLLAEDGLSFEREGRPGPNATSRSGDALSDGRMLFFKGASKEAIATLHRDGAGRTTVVLNVVTSLERIR